MSKDMQSKKGASHLTIYLCSEIIFQWVDNSVCGYIYERDQEESENRDEDWFLEKSGIWFAEVNQKIQEAIHRRHPYSKSKAREVEEYIGR